MKLFLDTNIFVEFVGRRDQFESVSRIIDAILEDEHIAFISTGCVYTLTYLFERTLKEQDIHRPEQTQRLRMLLSEVLNLATVVPLSHTETEKAFRSWKNDRKAFFILIFKHQKITALRDIRKAVKILFISRFRKTHQ